jgi:radical SAM-linked protein
VNRLRVLFRRGPELKYISHLDITRLWHRVLRRARVSLAYTEGFNPHPRIAMAAPLQLGATAEAELMDVWLDEPIAPEVFLNRLEKQLPGGLGVERAARIAPGMPALQAQVRFADYRLEVGIVENMSLERSINCLIESTSLPWQHRRDTGVKAYDLRPLIDSIKIVAVSRGVATLDMRLSCGARGTGRPEQVVRALGLDMPLDICRTGLVLQKS